jgi:hypothetical protein
MFFGLQLAIHAQCGLVHGIRDSMLHALELSITLDTGDM